MIQETGLWSEWVHGVRTVAQMGPAQVQLSLGRLTVFNILFVPES